MSADFKVIRTREEVHAMIEALAKVGISAIFGGTKGDGFWMQRDGQTIQDPQVRSGNPAFWMWDDAHDLLIHEYMKPFTKAA